jgi:hypothetical protein
MKSGRIFLVLAAALACAACMARRAPAEPEWDMVGVVDSAAPGAGELRVLVREIETPSGERAGPAWLRVPRAVPVEVRRPDGTVSPADAGAIVPGARIAARHTGVELRSLPPQYIATRVRVLSR